MIERVRVAPAGAGLHEITGPVAAVVARAALQDGEGLCTLFVQHTSASLVVQENADPSARRDLERFLERLVPEGDPLYTHVQEGPDDMPAHVRSVLTPCSLTVPIAGGRADLGTWQGIYLWEHRTAPHRRRITVTVIGA